MNALSLLPALASTANAAPAIVNAITAPARHRHELRLQRQQGGLDVARSLVEGLPAMVASVSNAWSEHERTEQARIGAGVEMERLRTEREGLRLAHRANATSVEALVLLSGHEPDAGNRLAIIQAIADRR